MPKNKEHLGRQMGKSLADVLFEAGAKEAEIKAVYADLEKLHQAFSPEVSRFFQNPVFDQNEKLTVLNQMAGKMELSDTTLRFIEIAIKQNLMKYLTQMVESFSSTVRSHRNEVEASLITAFKLTDKESEEITGALSKALGKQVVCNIDVDPELIGGVVARVGGVVFDASIRGYLDRIQEDLI